MVPTGANCSKCSEHVAQNVLTSRRKFRLGRYAWDISFAVNLTIFIVIYFNVFFSEMRHSSNHTFKVWGVVIVEALTPNTMRDRLKMTSDRSFVVHHEQGYRLPRPHRQTTSPRRWSLESFSKDCKAKQWEKPKTGNRKGISRNQIIYFGLWTLMAV